MTLDLDSIFDVQVKRIHEYKRQLLERPAHRRGVPAHQGGPRRTEPYPRTYLFGGKAAPGYAMAKAIIKLVNSVADVVNHDVDVQGRITVAFLRTTACRSPSGSSPPRSVSEQISTAGKEASGTGNMKFALNGALTIGTLDGANVEIREEVGAENFFLFGLTVERGRRRSQKRGYDPWECVPRATGACKGVLDALAVRRVLAGASRRCSGRWWTRS